MDTNSALRDHLRRLLDWHDAHVDFDTAVADMPPDRAGVRPDGLPYSAWELLEHMRLAQRDILEYIRTPQHVSPEWPAGYWPLPVPPTKTAWDRSVRGFQADLKTLADMAGDPATDLLSRVPHDPDGPTILHELLLVADHNAYHLGQLIVLRRILGAWED